MDTKLKSSSKWGFLAALIVIFAASGLMMGLYPWFEGLARAQAETISQQVMDEAVMSGYYTNIGETLYIFHDYDKVMSQIVWALLGASCMTAAAAFILALIRPLRLTEIWIFRAPLELTGLVFFCVCAFFADSGYFFSDLVWSTIIGELPAAFMDEFYLADATGIVWGINFIVWLLLFFIIYWIVTCASSLFTLGPVRYFKERTLTGRAIRFLARMFRKTYDLVESVDFRDEPTRLILKLVAVNFALVAVISCFWFFGIIGLIVYSVVLFFVLKRNYCGMQEKYQLLLKTTNQLAEGNLDVEIEEELGIFEPLGEELKRIQAGFKKAVEEEVKSQSMKTQLITNVSHDLKTPLTAIITYVNLLKKDDITKEEQANYIQVLDQKSMRLKRLIEDLFEVSKANSKNVTLNLMDVDIVSLMKQVRLELGDAIEGSNVDFRWNLPENKLTLLLDSDKSYRIFENLLVNITKYAMPGTRAYVDMEEIDGHARVAFKNISASEIALNGSQLTERFVRGDDSRNTEGSGLGLAIAKSFVELQKGKMEVETEADLFKVTIWWKTEKQGA